MTPSEVEKLAREAGLDMPDWMCGLERTAFTRFAELIERAAMEKAAKIAEAGIDSLEQARAEKAVRAAAKSGDEDDEVRRLRHHTGVSLHNGALQRAAAAIRAAAQKEA